MYDVLSKTRCTGNAYKESVLDQWESSGKVYYSLEGVTQEWVDLACRESAIAKFYADIWQKLPASQSSWMHVYALRGGVTCMPVLLRKSIPNDRPTDRPTDPPTESRADAHDRAFSLSLSLSRRASCISNPPITDPFRAHLLPQRTTHHFFNPHSTTRTDQLGSPATYVGWETPLKRLHTNASALMRFYK